MRETRHLLCAGCLLWLGATAQAQDPNLIDITNLEQLNAIRYDLNGDGISNNNAEKYRAAFGGQDPVCESDCRGYELTRDLDFEDADSYAGDVNNDWVNPENGGTDGTKGWIPLGNELSPGEEGIVGVQEYDKGSFNTTFEGNGHTISNLYANHGGVSRVVTIGFFGDISGNARIYNLGIVDGFVRGSESVGMLVASNKGVIRRCYARGGEVRGLSRVGGLVGFSSGLVAISFTTCQARSSSSHGEAGGIVGRNEGNAQIRGCYTTGNARAQFIAGGIAGRNGGLVTASYTTGNVTAEGSQASSGVSAGGIVGSNDGPVIACYSTATIRATGNRARAGGIVGAAGAVGSSSGRNSRITASYGRSDVMASGDDAVHHGLAPPGAAAITNRNSYFEGSGGKTTSELQNPTDYSGIFADWNVDVDNGSRIGMENSRRGGDSEPDNPWVFGTDSQYPALRVDFNRDECASAAEFGTQNTTDPEGTCPGSVNNVFLVTPNATHLPKLYPNPTAKEFRLLNLAPHRRYVYKIYSIVGYLLDEGEVHGNSSINVEHIGAGQHIFLLQEDEREVIRTRLLLSK